jgi:hypothetical protein
MCTLYVWSNSGTGTEENEREEQQVRRDGERFVPHEERLQDPIPGW